MMEDYEIIHRHKKYENFKVMNDYVTESARKYLHKGIYLLQVIFSASGFCIIYISSRTAIKAASQTYKKI